MPTLKLQKGWLKLLCHFSVSNIILIPILKTDNVNSNDNNNESKILARIQKHGSIWNMVLPSNFEV